MQSQTNAPEFDNPYEAPLAASAAPSLPAWTEPGSEPGAVHYPLARRFARLAAKFLDSVFLGGFSGGGFALGMFIGIAVNGGALPDDGVGVFVPLGGLLVGFGVAAFLQLRSVFAHNATLGKKALGIRVHRLDGKRYDFSTLLKRGGSMYVLGAVPGAGGIVNLVDALMIFNEQRRCLHDLFAGTCVIEVGKNPGLWTPEAIVASRPPEGYWA